MHLERHLGVVYRVALEAHRETASRSLALHLRDKFFFEKEWCLSACGSAQHLPVLLGQSRGVGPALPVKKSLRDLIMEKTASANDFIYFRVKLGKELGVVSHLQFLLCAETPAEQLLINLQNGEVMLELADCAQLSRCDPRQDNRFSVRLSANLVGALNVFTLYSHTLPAMVACSNALTQHKVHFEEYLRVLLANFVDWEAACTLAQQNLERANLGSKDDTLPFEQQKAVKELIPERGLLLMDASRAVWQAADLPGHLRAWL